jgi:hypothetical protein
MTKARYLVFNIVSRISMEVHMKTVQNLSGLSQDAGASVPSVNTGKPIRQRAAHVGRMIGSFFEQAPTPLPPGIQNGTLQAGIYRFARL